MSADDDCQLGDALAGGGCQRPLACVVVQAANSGRMHVQVHTCWPRSRGIAFAPSAARPIPADLTRSRI
jgi:hypothetical protein